jgi:hypothetical protein
MEQQMKCIGLSSFNKLSTLLPSCQGIGNTWGHVIWISATSLNTYIGKDYQLVGLHLHCSNALLFQVMPSLQQRLAIHNNINSYTFNITMPYHLQ